MLFPGIAALSSITALFAWGLAGRPNALLYVANGLTSHLGFVKWQPTHPAFLSISQATASFIDLYQCGPAKEHYARVVLKEMGDAHGIGRHAECEPMTPQLFETRQLPVSAQFQAWRAWNMPLLDVTALVPTSDGFPAENRVWKLDDGLLVATIAAPAARTLRSPRLLRQLPVDHWVVSKMLLGTTSLETPRGTVEVLAGQTYIWSLGQTSSSTCSQIDRVDLLLSRDTFRDIAPLLDMAIGSVLSTALGQFLGEFLETLVQRLSLLPESDAPLLSAAIARLLAACVAPSAERLDAARALIDVGRMERVRQTVRSHLQSPLLGPQMLSRQVGMSRSNLYRLLESEGGVTSYIQRRRLTEARGRLSDSRNTQPIASMAYDLGFADSSSFSRAFRAMFGVSPGEMRATAMKLGAPPPAPPVRLVQSCTCFADLLREPRPGQPGFDDRRVRSSDAARVDATVQ
jgi:AraC-like DNA-binding protein